MRSVDEPWKDRVLRGSRDGFVETIVSNVALIRRRIRDPRLCVEILHAGIKSRTDISVAYLEGVADMKLLRKIKDKIEQLDVEALTMNIESLAEAVLDGPYIRFRSLNIPKDRIQRQHPYLTEILCSLWIIPLRLSSCRQVYSTLWRRRTISIFRRL